MARRMGHRTILSIPLLRGEEAIGSLSIRRTEIRPFTAKQIELAETFADQAVIAIENVRLFDEVQARTDDLVESLQQQTATADVLKVISRSAFDLQPVLDTIVQTASRLCEAEFALIFKLQGDKYEIASANNAAEAFVKHAAEHPIRPERGSLIGRTALERQTVHIPDCLADREYSALDYQAAGHYRTMLGVPLLREGVPIGVIGLMRAAVRPFTDKQIELVTTFADQAVIAIENVRLFDEVQARTKELQESLEYQTATSNVLGVISRSPNELEPVLDAIAETAAHLCGADFAFVYKLAADTFHLAASNNASADWVQYVRDYPVGPGRSTVVGRTLLERRTIHVEDVLADREYTDVQRQRLGNYRTVLGVPLLRDQTPIGAIILVRSAVKPFAVKQVELVETFADQAVIAIENVRLFDEVQARTEDLRESLQQQTATADVLKLISRSAFDLETVLSTLLASAARLCEAENGFIFLRKENHYCMASNYGFSASSRPSQGLTLYRSAVPALPLARERPGA